MNFNRWVQLMEAVGFPKNQETFDLLVGAYNERHRKYHNEKHIDAVLSNLDKSIHLAADRKAVELGLWFHDAIYKIFSKTNELDSAKLAKKFVSENSGNEQLSEYVYSLILATQHNSTVQSNDEKLIVDIDLAILGSSKSDYDMFEQSIRKEYRLIPWIVYKKKRIEILNWFLDRESIYSHQHFRDSFEVKARVNLKNAIENLKGA